PSQISPEVWLSISASTLTRQRARQQPSLGTKKALHGLYNTHTGLYSLDCALSPAQLSYAPGIRQYSHRWRARSNTTCRNAGGIEGSVIAVRREHPLSL